MAALCARIDRESPSQTNAQGGHHVPLRHGFVRDLAARVFAITAAAGFVLLIAGANVASLLLVRLVERGEGRPRCGPPSGRRAPRLVGRFVLESLWLAAAGIVVGVLLAGALTAPLYALAVATTRPAARCASSATR